MRIVLTGATGFLGNAVLDALIAEGNEVCVLVRPDSNLERLNQQYALHIIKYVSLLSNDVIGQLRSWQPHTMIHLAWKGVSSNKESNAFQFVDNIPFTLDAVTLAHQAGCKQWIGVGSQAEYGIPNKKTAETDVCHPVTDYGKAKLAACIASLGLCNTLNMVGKWCRVFSVYGPGDHTSTFISYIIESFRQGVKPTLTACEQEWDYLYVTDAASAISKLIQADTSGIFNIGSGTVITLRKVVDYIKEIMNNKGDVEYGKPYASQQIMHLQADIMKLKLATGWSPVVTLKEGIQNTILSFQARPALTNSL